MIDLAFLDESGFAPTLPTGYSWGRLGTRLVVPYEAPQGRRVNAVGAFAPYDPGGPQLVFETRRKTAGRYDAAAHLAFVRRVARERLGITPDEIDGGHTPALSRPKELADRLRGYATEGSGSVG